MWHERHHGTTNCLYMLLWHRYRSIQRIRCSILDSRRMIGLSIDHNAHRLHALCIRIGHQDVDEVFRVHHIVKLVVDRLCMRRLASMDCQRNHRNNGRIDVQCIHGCNHKLVHHLVPSNMFEQSYFHRSMGMDIAIVWKMIRKKNNLKKKTLQNVNCAKNTYSACNLSVWIAICSWWARFFFTNATT